MAFEQQLPAYFRQQCLLIPGRLSDKAMQALVGAAHRIRMDARRHRLDTFALTIQQQARAVALQRLGTIGMTDSTR